jgi:hypothetical protein
MTIIDGTNINMAALSYCFVKAHKHLNAMRFDKALDKFYEFVDNGDIEFYVQGDDSIIWIAPYLWRDFDLEVFEAAFIIFGTPAEVEEDLVFLQKQIMSERGLAARISSRVVQNLYLREKPHPDEANERLSVATNIRDFLPHKDFPIIIGSPEFRSDLVNAFGRGTTWQSLTRDLNSGLLAMDAMKTPKSFESALMAATYGQIEDALNPEVLLMFGLGNQFQVKKMIKFLANNTLQMSERDNPQYTVDIESSKHLRHISDKWGVPNLQLIGA